ncbi:9361_t:CDS:2, partial [Dentiscutata heterogama]
IRSGKDNLNELENKIKEFQQSVLSVTSITSFINKYKSVSMKADLLPILNARGIDYLNKNLTINKILLEHQKNHIYILFDTDNYIINIDSPVWSAFLKIPSINEEPSKFFIADPTSYKGTDRPDHPVIHHYINGQLNSNDYYNDKKTLFTSNIIKFSTLPFTKPNYSPSKKERLMVPCPCSLTNGCLPLKCEWICIRCEQYIEYGYNKHLYCGCGENKIDHCKFKCSSSLHISSYIPFDQNILVEFLPSVAPREEINILLLGETGTGKSTFINAFANYSKFNNLDDAISGKSCTKECGIYVFPVAENKVIRLIDTPGVGDTRGIEYDKKNFENILKNINYHAHLNGICILLKPNNSRLDVIFRFCIQELLSHLHKNAKDNIIFCFTNTRGTFFRPGYTLPVLNKQLKELESKSGIEIKVCKDTQYCFDNEPFRFLAANKKGIKFTDDEKKNFASSWEKSAKELVRLLQYISNCTPHKIIDTVSLNNARQTVMILCEPLAEINRNIQENISEVNNLKDEIQSSNLTDEELKNKLYVPRIVLKLTRLERPRVVCTNNNCKVQNINITIENCHVKWKDLNIFMLKHSGAMMFGNCRSCGCHARSHKTTFYKSISEYSKETDENIKNKILKNEIDQKDKQDHIEMLQRKINQLKEQQNTVDDIIIQFTQFLIQNAIAPFNDVYMEYLDYIIHLEREKINNTSKRYNNEILKGLEETKRKYYEKMKIIKKKIGNNEPSPARSLLKT